jgi:hypothetical protein
MRLYDTAAFIVKHLQSIMSFTTPQSRTEVTTRDLFHLRVVSDYL